MPDARSRAALDTLAGQKKESFVAKKHPNIVYIHSHDTGRFIEPYGYPVSTPNLARFAENAIVFRNAYCACPTCSPSRSALLTGMYPHSAGMLGLAHRGFSMPDYSRHVVNVLAAAGYETALAGVQHEAAARGDTPAWQVIGYDTALSERADAHIAAAEYIRRQHEKPFFLAVGFFETHREFPAVADASTPDRVTVPSGLPNVPAVRTDFARYAEMATELDRKVGTVLDAIEAAGIADDTLVISTTDHGIAFPFHKCNLTEAGCGVYLMMRGPGGFSGGRTIDALVSQIDVVPTVCELIGIPIPAHAQGKSFLPLVRGETDRTREHVFCEVNYHAAYEPMRGVRTDRYAYVKRFDGPRTPVLANVDDGETKSYLLENGWKDAALPDEALFDRLWDPEEKHNVIADPAYVTVKRELAGAIDRWMRETDDPLLAGPVPAPAGARINSATDVSPREPVA